MKIKELLKAFGELEDTRSISNQTIVDALSEGIEKAFRKHVNCPDATVRVDIDEKGVIRTYQLKTVVEEVEDDEIEVSLEDAKEENKKAALGDTIEYEFSITEFSRACVTIVKNIMMQKIREATKQVIYDEYIDHVDDLVYGTVQTVEEKFVLIDLGRTLALMLKNEQIPNEIYKEGSRIRVVIKDVNKDSKGAQVLVSRSSANLVKRLFECTVPEIYEGTVEIKAIAREANERTKMAVYSKNVNVDPIGACIGPRGQRIVDVITEITANNKSVVHENIDIVEYNPDLVEYVKNVMKPAVVTAVVPIEEGNQVLVVVEDNQLSLAIGKKGINARLASKLLNKKVDIKTVSAANELGIDYQSEMAKFQAKQQAELAIKEAERLQAEREAAVAAAKEKAAKLAVDDDYNEEDEDEIIIEDNSVIETLESATIEKEEEDKKAAEVVKHRKPKLTVKASDYVSKFEELAEVKKADAQPTGKKKKANKEDEEDKAIKEKLDLLKGKDYEIKPEYTESELEEFENADDDHWYDDDDVDFDDFDEFYEEK